jgi:hypothetical protein
MSAREGPALAGLWRRGGPALVGIVGRAEAAIVEKTHERYAVREAVGDHTLATLS